MKISPEGIRLIKSFEGYHTRLPNGDCAAYLCPAKVPTIGYGCTEGVKLGMTWTEAEAENGLARELAKFENGVLRLVRVHLSQNEFDALVSFSYNVGLGALGKSTLLRKLNAGDRLGAAQQFDAWTKGGGKVLPGLVARRKREAALFLKPSRAPNDPIMPQAVSKRVEVSEPVVAVGGLTAGGTAAVALPSIPAPPDIESIRMWKSTAEQVSDLLTWAIDRPILVSACVVWVLACAFFSPRFTWSRSS
jgi:lysozyme